MKPTHYSTFTGRVKRRRSRRTFQRITLQTDHALDQIAAALDVSFVLAGRHGARLAQLGIVAAQNAVRVLRSSVH